MARTTESTGSGEKKRGIGSRNAGRENTAEKAVATVVRGVTAGTETGTSGGIVMAVMTDGDTAMTGGRVMTERGWIMEGNSSTGGNFELFCFNDIIWTTFYYLEMGSQGG